MKQQTMLPCQNCGAELFGSGAEETTKEVPRDFEFGGQQATFDCPALVCPECGEVTAL